MRRPSAFADRSYLAVLVAACLIYPLAMVGFYLYPKQAGDFSLLAAVRVGMDSLWQSVLCFFPCLLVARRMFISWQRPYWLRVLCAVLMVSIWGSASSLFCALLLCYAAGGYIIWEAVSVLSLLLNVPIYISLAYFLYSLRPAVLRQLPSPPPPVPLSMFPLGVSFVANVVIGVLIGGIASLVSPLLWGRFIVLIVNMSIISIWPALLLAQIAAPLCKGRVIRVLCSVLIILGGVLFSQWAWFSTNIYDFDGLVSQVLLFLPGLIAGLASHLRLLRRMESSPAS